MSSPIDWVVLGAGLMGRLVSCGLAERGLRVAVHEAGGPDATDAAAHIAAAMLAPLAESAITEDNVVRMGRHALARWPQLITTLDAPVFLQQQGTVILWHRQDAPEAERLARLFNAAAARIEGLSAPVACDGDALRDLEPALGRRFTQGLYLPQEGQLDNRMLLEALGRRMTALGIELHWHEARAPHDFPPDTALVDCRGLGARDDWPGLRGVRGEVVRLHAPGIGLSRPTRLVHPRYPIYIAPKPGDVYVIGATEIESDDRSPPSARSILELLSAAYSVHPGFGEARVLEIGAQCRPTLPDNLPALRRLGPRRWQVNGLYRHGFLIAPAVLDALLECLADDHSPLAQRLGLRIEIAQP